jgi:flagellar hook-associated protein 3 FlgL
MRISFNSTYREAVANLATSAERLAKAQVEVSSGKRVQKPSDDPTAAQAAVLDRGELATIDRYQQASDSVRSRLSIVDSVLSDVVTQVTTARATVLGIRGSAVASSQREAAAGEIDAIREALLADMNTEYRGTYLFSGAASLTAPYARQADGSVGAYRGDANTVSVDIDRNQSVQASINGDEMMRGTETDGLLTVLGRLSTAIRNGDDAGIEAGETALDAAFKRAVRVQSRVGDELRRLDEQGPRLDSLALAAEGRLSKHEDTDMVDAISRMNQADAAYRAGLGATSTIARLSLMDYLK